MTAQCVVPAKWQIRTIIYSPSLDSIFVARIIISDHHTRSYKFIHDKRVILPHTAHVWRSVSNTASTASTASTGSRFNDEINFDQFVNSYKRYSVVTLFQNMARLMLPHHTPPTTHRVNWNNISRTAFVYVYIRKQISFNMQKSSKCNGHFTVNVYVHFLPTSFYFSYIPMTLIKSFGWKNDF